MNHVDITKAITHVGLCAGYGGIELGLKRVLPTLRTVALCEIEAFACANLVAKMEAGLMDAAPVWTDLKTFPWEEFRDRVDILSGGYPCQPFSSAGKRLGADDPRHLWPHIASGIRLLRPNACFFENVEGHISLGLSTVVSDLEEMGYRTTWGIFSAAECGAPHQRKRVFVMANRKGAGLERYSGLLAGCNESRRDSSGSPGSTDGSNHGRDVWPIRPGELADAELHGYNHANARLNKDRFQGALGQGHEHRQTIGNGQLWPSRPGESQHAWEPPRVVANAEGSVSRIKAKRQWRESAGGASEEVVGNAADAGQPQRGSGEVERSKSEQEPQRSDCTHDNAECETQPTLVRNINEFAGGMDYAELCVTCDNRTDELRLLGNGVVPATAALAFRTLFAELFSKV